MQCIIVNAQIPQPRSTLYPGHTLQSLTSTVIRTTAEEICSITAFSHAP